MSIESNEEAMLTAFARAASKAQEIEALLQEMLIAAEVATDTKNRSFEEIAAEIEKLPLGPLKEKFLRVAQMADPLFPKMWKEIAHNETLSVIAMCVCNPDRGPSRIDG